MCGLSFQKVFFFSHVSRHVCQGKLVRGYTNELIHSFRIFANSKYVFNENNGSR